MKKIIITLLIYFLSVFSVFADTNIDLSSDKNSYNIDDNIVLNIKVESDLDKWIELKINWLDNFQIVWQSKSQSTSIINNKKNTSFNLQLSLLAKKAWNYTIWPIVIGSGDSEVKSKTINIKVTWERIMVNPNVQQTQSNTATKDDFDKNIDDVDLDNNWKNNKKVDIVPKKIIWVNWEEMSDIYPPKDKLFWYLFSKISVIVLIFLLLLILLYHFTKKYLDEFINKYFNKKEIKQEIKQKPKKRINYSKLLKDIRKKYINDKKEIFYAKLWEVFRIYLDDKIENWLSKKSFSEIKNSKNIDSELINIYEKIYFPEYDNVEDNLEKRENILEEIDWLIKNNNK